MLRTHKSDLENKVISQILTACRKMPLVRLDSLVDRIVAIRNERVHANGVDGICQVRTSENKIKELTVMTTTRNPSRRGW